MERVRYIYRLKPGAGPEYDLAHASVPAEILNLIAEAGISNYTIWRHDDIVVSEFDTKLGFEETKQLLAASMVQRNWTARLAHLFLKIDADGDPLWLEQVFRYDGDLSDRPPLPIEKKLSDS